MRKIDLGVQFKIRVHVKGHILLRAGQVTLPGSWWGV